MHRLARGASARAHGAVARALTAGRARAPHVRGGGGGLEGVGTAFPDPAAYMLPLRVAGSGNELFDLLPPAWAARTTAYGPMGDGRKFLLDVGYLNKPRAHTAGERPPCVVYSLGGNLQTEFEEAMLAATTCDVVTLDCTVSEAVMVGVIARTPRAAGRFFFEPVCLGPDGATAFIAGSRVVLRSASSVMAELGHARVDILKMDIENGEHTALPDFLRDQARSLPSQISLELHWLGWEDSGLRALEVVRALVRAGYVLIAREDNPYCTRGGCTELTWVLGCGGVS